MLDEEEIEAEDNAGDDASLSWSSRIRSGTHRAGAGLIFLAALCLLFWNETSSKHQADGLAEIAAQVQPGAASAPDAALDGRPVHLSARVHSDTGTRDPFFGVGAEGAVLYREVEMFQWIEYRETTGRGSKKRTHYSYAQDWDSEYHDSSRFHEPKGHENPKPALESETFIATDAHLGPYRFDHTVVAHRALAEMENADGLGSLGRWPQFLETLPKVSDELAAMRWYELEAGVYYRGDAKSEEAELGDLRVAFYPFSNDYPLSMIGRQEGDRLTPWRASNGEEMLLAAAGALDAKTVVQIAESRQAGFTSLLRLVGLAAAVLGAAGVARWLGGFLMAIPVVGRLVSMSLAVAGGLFGLMAGLVTIVVGWLAARPWIAGLLLLAIVGATAFAIRKWKRNATGRNARADESRMPMPPVAAPPPMPAPPPPTAEPRAVAATSASTQAPPAPTTSPAPAPAATRNLRITLGSKGDYVLNKLVREHPDGRQDLVCFELMRAGQPIKRGTQDEVKEALRLALAAASPA